MIVYGLTGSIGMGKSTAAHILRQMGIPVHDADAQVRRLLSPKGAGFEEVALTFPEAWDKKTRHIKRDVLADIVFNDAARRNELEGILHPHVHAAQQKFILTARRMQRRRVVLDIPLLFETGAQNRVDRTILVTAPYHYQRRRVLSRPGMDEDRFLKILNTQMPDLQKRALADFIVQTGFGMAYTYRRLQKIMTL